MKGKLVARRYAKALINIGKAEGTVEKIGEELRNMATLLDAYPRLREVLWNPFYGKEPRKAIIEEVVRLADLSRVMLGFFMLLIEKERFRLFDVILTSYQDLEDAHAGRMRAEVITAGPLNEEEIESIQSKLARIFKKEIVVETTLDESVIGGIICKIGSVVYDGTIRNQLERMKEQMRYN